MAPEGLKARLLEAALGHAVFDGWSDRTFRAACADTGTDPGLARAVLPRGAVDLALAFHAAGDAAMVRALKAGDVLALPVRARIAQAVRLRLEAIPDREAARRAASLFALPNHSADGAKAIWATADAIWSALDDPSQDFGWYSKRATLSAVYSATFLYWLGDESAEHASTWAFLDRRIDEVMRIEKVKAGLHANPLARTLLAPAAWAMGRVKAPSRAPRADLPGRLAEKVGDHL